MPKISIITPIYNSEQYLEQCLCSVISQTLRDIEIILIDDGSTDSSPEICDKYAELDKRIKVVHKQNEGMGKTYNLGIELATGDYIGFVESDDWIERTMYEDLLKNITEYDSDIVKCGLYYYKTDPERNTPPQLESNQLIEMECIKQPFNILQYEKLLFFHSSTWATLYKSDFVKTIKYSEEKGASYQDFSFMIDVLTKAKKISTLNKNLYHWRFGVGEHQSSTSPNNANLLKIIDQLHRGKNIIQERGLYDKLFSAFYKHCMIVSYIFYGNCPKEYKSEMFEKLREFYSDINLSNLSKAVKYLDYSEIAFLIGILSNDIKFANLKVWNS